MSNIDDLRDSTLVMLPDGIKTDLTVSNKFGLFFLTNVFRDGCLLGFWSHSPWGRCTDQEKGWVVLDRELNIVSECETKAFTNDPQGCLETGVGFSQWRANQKKLHGSALKLCDDITGESFWKMSET